ncbi:PQQ-dependent sugar dehydrogenase [Amphritea sp. 1_MG-2023]|uniref:PQQ-dependent sugar dehydrogenase n=1 Tax=Amphritea sp. 1_MG-2023 TaxID=3062670 RepID=UPI0026E4507D|nr:PQQ-dependent sugar dehydrogenase [Amphritea sp. 1_MG-2023]MDO6562338.1 PQQ-dependent sugar dehydrogenase [Amphritea sp. 1_MG-2023]
MYPISYLSRLLLCLALSASTAAQPIDRLKLPQGYQLTVAAAASNARQMALGEPGTLFVGSRRAGQVYRLRDTDGDGVYEQRDVLLRGLNMPSGIAYRDGDLYIAAVKQILRLNNADRVTPPAANTELITDRLPNISHHGWKYLKLGPEGELYFNLGAPCNSCLSDDPRFATLMKINLNTKTQTIVAHGVRNSVGFAWHPKTDELWFSDNGRDHLGDDQPDDELNRLSQPGQHFGYPFIHAGDIPDPKLYQQQAFSAFESPVLKLGAHVAPLGMTFYHGDQFPETDQSSLFIAQHGSWNRSRKVGYRVIKVDTSVTPPSQEVFIDGWLNGERAWGRPVDILTDRDGSLLISDDRAGLIYRVRYRGNSSALQ